MADQADNHNRRLAAAFVALGRSGRVRWARRPVEPEIIYCMVGGDLIRFELGQGQQPFNPAEPVGGIECVARNCHFLWLEGTDGWDDLLPLLTAVPVDSGDCPTLVRLAQEEIVRQLEQIAAGEPLC